MYYSTAYSGEIILGEEFNGALYQIHFPGQVSQQYYARASLFVQGHGHELGFQFYFDRNGRLTGGSKMHMNSDNYDILSSEETTPHEAAKDFEILRPRFAMLAHQGREKVKEVYRKTIDVVCQGQNAPFRN